MPKKPTPPTDHAAAVREAIKALDLADATLNAVVGYKDLLPRDLVIHAATVRNICQASAAELRQL